MYVSYNDIPYHDRMKILWGSFVLAMQKSTITFETEGK